MTTLKDLLFDMAKEVQEAEQQANDEAQTLDDREIQRIVDNTIEDIKNKIIG